MSGTSAPAEQDIRRDHNRFGRESAHAPGGAGGSANDDAWQRWQRPRPSPEELRKDVWVAALVMAGALVATVLVNSMGALAFGDAPALAEQLAWGVALTAPLAVRRRFPVLVALIVAGLFIAAQARHVGDNFVPSLALFLAIYSLGAWGADRVVARWVRVGIIVAMFGWLGFGMTETLMSPAPDFDGAAGPLDPLLAMTVHTIGFNLLFFLGAYFFGNIAWESARRQHELRVQGDQLRRSQMENARQAVTAERLRIARDLHDVVAHHVSVMGVQAAAARRVFDSDHNLARKSLDAVESTARTAIGELRGLLGVLRAEAHDDGAGERAGEGDGPHVSAPGLEEIEDLLQETRGTGLRVEYSTFGEPRPVPEAVALTAYRIVQEALTNTVRHAGASEVDVRVRYLDRLLEVEVSDDGRGAAVEPEPAGHRERSDAGGLGLVGMRERVAVHEGELEVGARRGGGFRVRARLPLEFRTEDESAGSGAASATTPVPDTSGHRPDSVVE
ncbi:sensor histidine kinase [Actinobacteria bacterium YIM 96077]|uniref:histidine kinase n=1 Tax=Phytoactinopolyspora halophila TaxID=1981511 RepID=A0A329QKY8_9ACTN|nr:sensor histidine kinase [Phytoactinopolyspora halophila]AYY14833.1 sensor histidine kinase [Actinobacteria bacterium YIM 96077]RAW13107.1 sensor histidine kinase [Phytoactinopolyspora halophila]